MIELVFLINLTKPIIVIKSDFLLKTKIYKSIIYIYAFDNYVIPYSGIHE
ncbi:hypothetical protein J2783_001090 [Chryseobacterium sediminis]|nr:hypothetical protein [Chryseobacterium sediminis]